MDQKDPSVVTAMQQKDIDYMKAAIQEVNFAIKELSQKFETYSAIFVKKDDNLREMDRLEKKIDTKVQQDEFDSLKQSVDWTAKLIIGEIVVIIGAGIIALITHFLK